MWESGRRGYCPCSYQQTNELLEKKTCYHGDGYYTNLAVIIHTCQHSDSTFKHPSSLYLLLILLRSFSTLCYYPPSLSLPLSLSLPPSLFLPAHERSIELLLVTHVPGETPVVSSLLTATAGGKSTWLAEQERKGGGEGRKGGGEGRKGGGERRKGGEEGRKGGGEGRKGL